MQQYSSGTRKLPAHRHRAVVLALIAALSLSVMLSVSSSASAANSVERETLVTSGGFRTLATLWNTTAGATFRCPSGAQIRVLYGYGWLSYSRQNQTLDCNTYKRLSVGGASVVGARMQIKVPATTYVSWTYTTS